MNLSVKTNEFDEMDNLSACVKSYIAERKYKECEELLSYSMYLHPHAPEPHNLWGILFEKEGKHGLAMSHFRAALDLKPSYLPARQNLEIFGTFFPHNRIFAYTNEDCVIKDK